MSRLLLAASISLIAPFGSPALAQTTYETRRAELLRERAAIDAELRALDGNAGRVAQTTSPTNPDRAWRADEIVVTGKALSLTTKIAGQTVTTIDDRTFRNTPAATIADIVKLSPGVVVIQGNGPRDVGVSIRGSNARNSFGARNIQVFEDDFPVTQPDGLARFDLTDPHGVAAVMQRRVGMGSQMRRHRDGADVDRTSRAQRRNPRLRVGGVAGKHRRLAGDRRGNVPNLHVIR